MRKVVTVLLAIGMLIGIVVINNAASSASTTGNEDTCVAISGSL